MAKSKEPSNAWEYVDWLYISNRLTAEEHITLKKFLFKLEDDSISESILSQQGC